MSVVMIKPVDRVNCTSTRVTLMSLPRTLVENLPFRTMRGLNEERTKAGYIPASNPTNSADRRSKKIKDGCSNTP